MLEVPSLSAEVPRGLQPASAQSGLRVPVSHFQAGLSSKRSQIYFLLAVVIVNVLRQSRSQRFQFLVLSISFEVKSVIVSGVTL